MLNQSDLSEESKIVLLSSKIRLKKRSGNPNGDLYVLTRLENGLRQWQAFNLLFLVRFLLEIYI